MAVKQKIMIVDDDASIAELISLYLRKECFDTLCVEDGEEALRQFAEYEPNLILLDLMLPGMDGYEVCRELRKNSKVPIIMLSAKGEIFDKVLGLELGADDYMIKPFDSKELVARVKAVLRRFTPEAEKPEEFPNEKQGDCVIYQDASEGSQNESGTWTMYIFVKAPMEAEDSVVLFNTMTIPATWDNAEMEKINGMTITVKAYATQTNGFTDCYTAMTTAFAEDFAPVA